MGEYTDIVGQPRDYDDEGDYIGGGEPVALVGATLHKVETHGSTVVLTTDRGTFTFAHRQDCCESVILEEAPETYDGTGEVILRAEVRVVDLPYQHGIRRATFYYIATEFDEVNMRWMGTSNGYYGVGVDVTFEPPSVSE